MLDGLARASDVGHAPHLRVGRLEPGHPADQVWLGRLHQEVVVVAHEDVSVDQPPCALARLRQGSDEALPVRVVLEDRLPTLPCPSRSGPGPMRSQYAEAGKRLNRRGT